MFITPAFADTATSAVADAAAGAAPGFQLSQFLPLILVFIVFYVVVIRPQSKRAQEHRSMISALKKGDKVVTGGGLLATVKDVVSEEEVVLELSEGVKVRALRATIMAKKD